MDDLLQVRDLSILYGDKRAVDRISFTVQPGEIVGYLGPNGAGKSSTIRAICGILPPSSGEVSVCGMDVRDAADQIKRVVGYVPEDAAVIEIFTPIEYFRFLSDLRGLPAQAYADTALEMLAWLELDEEALHQRMGGFSKGMKQKVAIVAALAHQPALVLLDEPLNGLDVESTQRFKQLLHQIAERGGAILYCSHLVDVMERFVQRVLILQQGALMADAPLPELLQAQEASTLEQAFSAITARAPAAAPSDSPTDLPTDSPSDAHSGEG